jgi:hypothetical protein
MIEVVFSEEVVGVGQGKKVTIIPDIKSAGDRGGGCHKKGREFQSICCLLRYRSVGSTLRNEMSQVQFFL